MRVLVAVIAVWVAPWAAAHAADDPNTLYRPQAEVTADPAAWYAPDLFTVRREPPGGPGPSQAPPRQSLAAYAASHPARPTVAQHTIYICPVGIVGPSIRRQLPIIRSFLGIFYALPVKIGRPVVLDGVICRIVPTGGREIPQYQIADVMRKTLAPHLPDDGICLVGVTSNHLYADHPLADAPGAASSEARVAIYDLERLLPGADGPGTGKRADDIALRRSLLRCAAAVGEMLGLGRCRRYGCAMNPASTRRGIDALPLRLCPDCLGKLRWNLGFDIVERYESLKRFYQGRKMTDDALWAAKRLAQCAAAARTPGQGVPSALKTTVKTPVETNRSPLPEELYRPQVHVEDDPGAFYALTHYRERGLSKTTGGFDADQRGWVESFKKYVANQPLRPTQARHTVYICPLGPMDSKMRGRMRTLRTFLEIYLTLPVKSMAAVPIAGRRSRLTRAHGREVRQYDTGHLRDNVLKPHLPDDALGVLGLTAQDLYSEEIDWDSVTSKTFSGGGFAVCSLTRLFPEPWGYTGTPKAEREGLALSLRMVASSCCGMLGPSPCRKYYCVLNQSRYVALDKPMHLCPDCLRKLRWSLGFDVIERYEALRQFYVRTGMRKEARWVAKRIAECRAGRGPQKRHTPEPAQPRRISKPAPAPH